MGAFERLRALGAPVGCKEKYEVKGRQGHFFCMICVLTLVVGFAVGLSVVGKREGALEG